MAEWLANCFEYKSPIQLRKLEGQWYFQVKVTLDISKPFFRWILFDISHFGLVDSQIRYEPLPFICYTCIRHTNYASSSPKPELSEIACPFPYRGHMYATDDNYSSSVMIIEFLTGQALVEARVSASFLSHSVVGTSFFPLSAAAFPSLPRSPAVARDNDEQHGILSHHIATHDKKLHGISPQVELHGSSSQVAMHETSPYMGAEQMHGELHAPPPSHKNLNAQIFHLMVRCMAPL